jgi:hypothetical protein
MNEATTKQQVLAAMNTAVAIAEAIRELKSVPSGHLYANVMGRMSLETFEAIIRTLKNADLIKETSSHELIWIAAY